MNTAELRQAFLDFFAERGHAVVASSSLVPGNDPTLLFTNAGMVQFKDVFLGKDKRSYTRAASSQRCVRAGGKHNDLENVGYTARHHTFFEMLGNFSFGDYFKEEAIRYGWAFLTDVLKLPAERLWVTVYEDDDEAADIWLNKLGVSAERFSRLGEKDNFWSMGDTGPCGPCSEIFFDHGPDVPGGPPGSPDEDGDRYVEVWNLVFMQFNRDADGSQTNLPKPSVDTGMGLERIAAVMQGVHSNYDIDLFASLIDAVCEVTGCTDRDNPSLRVIADHIRASAFLIIDGVVPSNEGRGYVLRRIIRRALRHGHQLGVSELFFHRLVAPLAALMGQAYPELARAADTTAQTLEREEERFAQTLSQGMNILEDAIGGLDGNVIPGDVVFKLYDTYGFPVDLTADIARERGLSVDHDGFEAAMNAQRERARAASKFGVDQTSGIASDARTDFQGYDGTAGEGVVTELFRGDESVGELRAGEEGVVIVDRTPFYAESGGQVGDQGELTAEGVRFVVRDTQKFGTAFGHVGVLEHGALQLGAPLALHVNEQRRQAIVLNHSATHLLHAALRSELGEHVTQKGSLVAAERLRFDFSHGAPLTDDELERIEDLVNEQIRANAAAQTRLMTLDDAIESGAMSLFGEKYDAQVRVLRLGDFSVELCGGTHVQRAGDIGLFKIIAETGIAAGVRRIEALTGAAALDYVHHNERLLRRIGQQLKAGREELDGRIEQVIVRNRAQEKELDELKRKLLGSRSTDVAADAQEINGLKVLAVRMDGADAKALRGAVDTLKDRLGSGVVVLGAAEGDKVRLVAGVTADATDRVKAGELIAMVAGKVGGRGGGRADMAQAGGNDPAALDAALASVVDWVRNATT